MRFKYILTKVFVNCKEKLLSKFDSKLNTPNTDILLQSLYILCNIATGNEQQKNIVFEHKFFNRIVKFLVRRIVKAGF